MATRYATDTAATYALKCHVAWCPMYPRQGLAGPGRGVANLVDRFKIRTSRVLRREFPSLRSRLSRSYFASSVNSVAGTSIRRFIEAQKGT